MWWAINCKQHAQSPVQAPLDMPKTASEFKQARAAFIQALEKAPNEPTLYRWRAEAQLEAEDLRGAQKSLGEALRLMPDDARSKVLLVDLKGRER